MIAVAILVAAIAGCKIYFLREYSHGDVLWNASEAYLFIGVSREGLHVSCLRYPWVFVKEYLGAAESRDDRRGSLIVIRVTPSGVEHHVLKLEDRTPGSGPDFITPLDGRIYTNYPALGGLCRWAGDHFELATQEERRKLDGINRLTVLDIDNGEKGWSKRGFPNGLTDYKFTVEVGDKFGLLVNNLALVGTATFSVSIDLLHSGKAPERIWDFHARQGRASEAEYRQAFPRP